MSRPALSGERIWTVEIVLAEDGQHTRADAWLRAGPQSRAGFGRSRRNPCDPDVPLVGDELAAARALSDLAHQLLEAALEEIEAFEPPAAH